MSGWGMFGSLVAVYFSNCQNASRHGSFRVPDARTDASMSDASVVRPSSREDWRGRLHRGGRLVLSLGFATLLAVLTGCASMNRQPFSLEMQQNAEIPGIPNARFWADAPDAAQRMTPPASRTGNAVTMLALSAGGNNGAYGAGLLNGWTKSGTRPDFSIVTGVSTGALVAPFAFLGPSYDAALADAFTHVSERDVSRARFPLAFLWTSSIADSEPLGHSIRARIGDGMIDQIAQEYRRGRRLFIGTANLDAERMVIWDMGAIAASGDPGRYDLFRKVLLASSSIPALFPPVMIDAVADGQKISEMHVDGGATAQILALPTQVVITDQRPPDSSRLHLYLVVNSKLGGDFHLAKPRTLPILQQAFSLHVQSSLFSLISTSYVFARDHGIDFNLSFIGNDFPTNDKFFDVSTMRQLYEYGFRRGVSGKFWEKRPPGEAEQIGTQTAAETPKTAP